MKLSIGALFQIKMLPVSVLYLSILTFRLSIVFIVIVLD